MNVQMMRSRGQELCVAVKPGAKNGPPLLLFNGIGANFELAEPFMRSLGDVEAVIFDIPGVGRSPLPTLPYRPSTVVAWGADIMAQARQPSSPGAPTSWRSSGTRSLTSPGSPGVARWRSNLRTVFRGSAGDSF